MATQEKRLLDLFCGAGGAAMGYYRAGFTQIVGIDIEPQPHYPFDFIQADALQPPVDLYRFDLIHASPPCQVHSKTKHLASAKHQDLIAATRELVRQHLYVIENVPGAPLHNPVALNGFYVGLNYIDRERWRFLLRLAVLSKKRNEPRPRSGHNLARIGSEGFVLISLGGIEMYVTQEINDLESTMDARTEEILSQLNRDLDRAVEEVIERLEMEPVRRSEAA